MVGEGGLTLPYGGEVRRRFFSRELVLVLSKVDSDERGGGAGTSGKMSKTAISFVKRLAKGGSGGGLIARG